MLTSARRNWTMQPISKNFQPAGGPRGRGATYMRQAIKLMLFSLALSSLLFAADYRFTQIDVPNASATFAQGINARGDIVGRYLDADGAVHGFLMHKGAFSTIDVPKAFSTGARAINAQGDVVGRTVDGNGNGHGYLATRRTLHQVRLPTSRRYCASRN